jgi:hypothetical protein
MLTMILKKYGFWFCVIMMLFAWGCSKIVDIKQKDSFSHSSKAYRQAILWSEFEYAMSFHKTDPQNPIELDPLYKKIKVTGYEEKHHVVNSDVSQIEQTVHIQYYWVDQMLEKNIMVNLLWEWDNNSNTWYLISGLPGFK